MTTLFQHLARMTPTSLYPASHSAERVYWAISQLQDPHAEVLRWASNDSCPMDDMLAAWVTIGEITIEQAMATSDARAGETQAFLAAYRANPPQPDAEQLAEMRNAFGPGAIVVNAVTGQSWRV
jgi:hypothetical protein